MNRTTRGFHAIELNWTKCVPNIETPILHSCPNQFIQFGRFYTVEIIARRLLVGCAVYPNGLLSLTHFNMQLNADSHDREIKRAEHFSECGFGNGNRRTAFAEEVWNGDKHWRQHINSEICILSAWNTPQFTVWHLQGTLATKHRPTLSKHTHFGQITHLLWWIFAKCSAIETFTTEMQRILVIRRSADSSINKLLAHGMHDNYSRRTTMCWRYVFIYICLHTVTVRGERVLSAHFSSSVTAEKLVINLRRWFTIDSQSRRLSQYFDL